MSEELGMNIKLTAEVADFSAKIESAKTKLANLAIEAKTLKQGEREIEAALKSAAKAYGEESKEVEKLNAKLVGNHKAQIDLKTETSKLNKELKQSQSTFDKLTKETKENTSALSANAKQADKTMQSIKTGFTMLKGMIVGYAGKTLFDALIGSNAQFEQKMTSFEVLLGGAEKAQKMMEDIEEFAAKTPLQMDDVSSATQLLLSYGVAQEDVMTRMRQLGDLAQGNAEKLDRVSLAYGQMLAKGKVTGEELRQMTEAGVPLVQALADVIGISTAELSKMLETGSVGIPELNKAIESMTSEGGKFYNMMEKQSQTMSGMWSTLADNAKIFSRDVGEETFEYLKGELNSLMDTINQMKESGELDEIAGDIGESIAGAIELLGNFIKFLYEMKDVLSLVIGTVISYKVAMRGLAIIQSIVTYGNALMATFQSISAAQAVGITSSTLYKAAVLQDAAALQACSAAGIKEIAVKNGQTIATGAATGATLSFNAALLASPIMQVVAAVGLLVAAFVKFNSVADESTNEIKKVYKELDEMRESYGESADSIEDATKRIEENTSATEAQLNVVSKTIPRLDELAGKTDRTAEENSELNRIIEDLNDAMPSLKLAIDEETGALNRNVAEVWKAVDAYTALARAKAAENLLVKAQENKLKAEKIMDETKDVATITGWSWKDPLGFHFLFDEKDTPYQIAEEEALKYAKEAEFYSKKYDEESAKWEELRPKYDEDNQSSYSGSSISGGSSSSSSSSTKEKEPVYREFSYIYPFDKQYKTTSGWWDTNGRATPHDAIDIGAPYGTPVLASNYGVVTYAGYADGYGRNYVVIDHGTYNGKKYETTYGHMSSMNVSVGQKVERGEKIGEVGSEGNSTGNHLDFRFKVNGVPVNPLDALSGKYGGVLATDSGSASSTLEDEYDDFQEQLRQQKVSDYKESNSKKMSDFERQMKMDFAYGYITEEEFIKSIEIEAQAYKELADDVLKQDYMTTQEKMDLWEEYFKKSEDLALDHYEQLKAYEKDNLNYSIEQSKKWMDDRKADGQWPEGDNIVAAWGRVIEKYKKFYNEDFYNINQAREYLDGLSSLMDEATADILETMDKAVSEVSALKKEAYEKEQAAEQERIEKQFEETEKALNRELELVKKKYNDRISYLDMLKKERSRQKEDEDDNLKMERLQTKLEYEMDEGNKKSLQREINSLNEEIEDKEFDRWIEAEKEKANSAMEIETEKIEAMIEKEKIKRMEMIDYVAEYYAEKMTEDALHSESINFLDSKIFPLPISTLNQMNGLFDTIDINGIAWRVADLVDIAGAFLEKYGFAGNQTVINNYKNDNSTTTISSTYQIKDLSKSEITKAKQKSLEEYIRDGYVL